MDSSGKPIASSDLINRMNKQMGSPDTVRAVGANSLPSFTDRQRIEKHRKRIGSYKDSTLGRAKPSPADVAQLSTMKGSATLQAGDSSGSPVQKVETGQNRPSSGFQEPASRRHHPLS